MITNWEGGSRIGELSDLRNCKSTKTMQKKERRIMLLFEERVDRCKCFLILGQIRWKETLAERRREKN